MARKPKAVEGEWSPTECDLEGVCPHCSVTVWETYNPIYCGTCGRKIRWTLKSEVGKIEKELLS